MSRRLKQILLIMFLALLPAFSAFAEETPGTPLVRLSPGDHPGGDIIFLPAPDEQEPVRAEPEWYSKAGAAKGLSGRAATAVERALAPDIAVLARGFFKQWQALLAAEQEPFVPVQPGDIGSISSHKSLLIIPSGALSGTAGSPLFKAGLAHFVRAGGVVFCLSQRTGLDYASLPVPEGQRLQAAGWSEDSGPLFRSSAILSRNRILSGLKKDIPALETDGRFTAYPAGSKVLLGRADKSPTLIVYPFGKGRVVVSTLFTDLSSLLGEIETDEKELIRGLLDWMREPRKQQASPAAASSSRPTGSADAANEPPPARLVVRAAAERKGDRVDLQLELSPASGWTGRTVLIRSKGRERSVTLTKESTQTFSVPVRADERRIAFAVYRSNGRAVTRGSVAVPQDAGFASPGRSYYLPDDKAAVVYSAAEPGEVILTGMGLLERAMVSNKGTMDLRMPGDLPAGTYRMHWQFQAMNEEKSSGGFSMDLAGYRADIQGVSVDSRQENSRISATAAITVRATQQVSGQVQLLVKGPDGRTEAVAESALSLAKGTRTVSVPFSFKPSLSGMWELQCRFSTLLPRGVDIPESPVLLASAGSLFDIGGLGVTSIETDRNFYYEPSGPVTVTAILAGSGKASVKVLLDDTPISSEPVDLPGVLHYSRTIPSMAPGTHILRVSLANDAYTTTREHAITYGLNLPDLGVVMRYGEPAQGAQGPVLPVGIVVRNEGKTSSAPVRAALSEGDPAQGGTAIAILDVKPLSPGGEQSLSFPWPLWGKAGARTLFANVDSTDSLRESDKRNNRTSARITLPDVLLTAAPEKDAYSSTEQFVLPALVSNIASTASRSLRLDLAIQDRNGKTVSAEKRLLGVLAPSARTKVPLEFGLTSFPAGTYQVTAVLSGGNQPVSVETRFGVLPTLQLSGGLDGTPDDAVLCRPFKVMVSFTNEGNLYPNIGSGRLEVRHAGTNETVFVKQFPLSLGRKQLLIENIDLPPGAYLMRLSASATNNQYKLTREFMLAERPVLVKGPVTARRVVSDFPRVLIWRGKDGREVERAVSEKIVHQAFESEDLFYRIVESEEQFSIQAMTGMFNTYVLFEPAEVMSRIDWLKDRIARGDGLVVIGSGETARSAAESLGFTFQELSKQAVPRMVLFSGQSGFGVTGNMPVTGALLVPVKKGAKTAGLYSGEQPAVLADRNGAGTIVVMPFSFSESAYQGGATAIYSLVLRTSTLFAAPRKDPTGAGTGAFLVSSPVGTIKTRVTEKLPSGSRVLWTNQAGTARKNVITFEATADKNPAKFLYVYQPPVETAAEPEAEAWYECEGTFRSQGKIE